MHRDAQNHLMIPHIPYRIPWTLSELVSIADGFWFKGQHGVTVEGYLVNQGDEIGPFKHRTQAQGFVLSPKDEGEFQKPDHDEGNSLSGWIPWAIVIVTKTASALADVIPEPVRTIFLVSFSMIPPKSLSMQM